jgi:hypothetical protein
MGVPADHDVARDLCDGDHGLQLRSGNVKALQRGDRWGLAGIRADEVANRANGAHLEATGRE